MAVLSSVASDHLEGAVVSLQGEVHLQNVRAGLYQSEDPVTLGHLLVPGNPHVLHMVINQCVLHQHAETKQIRKEKYNYKSNLRLFGLGRSAKKLKNMLSPVK